MESRSTTRKSPAGATADKHSVRGAKSEKASLPDFIKPELATLVDAVPAGGRWLHEIKFDGYRILCRIDSGKISLLTREAKDWSDRFPSVVAAIKKLSLRQALLDGEVVALDPQGKSDFQRLQNSLRQDAAARIVYVVFDLLFLNGRQLTASPLKSRKDNLERLLKTPAGKALSESIRYSDHWSGKGEALYRNACQMGLEGIIAKKADSPYRSGRGHDWLKVKCLKSQEFVIGGFTDPAGSRAGLGALLLGVHDSKHNLRYAGRVGTGFNQKMLKQLRARLDRIAQNTSPFAGPIAARQSKGVHWVTPALVGEVSFSGWTRDGILRHPAFKSLREDKPPEQILREEAESAANLASLKTPDAVSQDTIAGIKLTHPGRILYPDQGITKRELALYYQNVADWILPQLEGRPLTLVRCPSGQQKQCFYQRHAGAGLDPAIQSMRIKENGKWVSHLSIDSLSGLVALVQMGVLEIHTWGSRRQQIERPDRLIFDLDPDPELPWHKLAEAARALRSSLADLGLEAFVKTTGGKGLHVVTPIAPTQDWNFAKQFSKFVARRIVEESPERYTATMSKAKRKGKIFIDYLRNARSATAICAYSTRAQRGAPVSMPLRWEELAADVRTKFTLKSVPQQLAELRKDPWKGYEAARARLTRLLMKKLLASRNEK